jgi:cystathionine beta-lyase/cystathionine gamma-synthase
MHRNSAFPIAYRLVRRAGAEPILQGRFVFSDAPGNVYQRWQDLETIDEFAQEQADG